MGAIPRKKGFPGIYGRAPQGTTCPRLILGHAPHFRNSAMITPPSALFGRVQLFQRGHPQLLGKGQGAHGLGPRSCPILGLVGIVVEARISQLDVQLAHHLGQLLDPLLGLAHVRPQGQHRIAVRLFRGGGLWRSGVFSLDFSAGASPDSRNLR